MFPTIRAALLTGLLIASAQTAHAETLTLEQAIAKALDGSPALQANDAAVSAAEAGKRQAGVRPNPRISVEAENFIGTGPYFILGQSQITGTYTQTIERGGKREARTALAGREVDVAKAQGRITRLDLAAAVQKAYVDVQIANELVRIGAYRLGVEQGVQAEAFRRVRGYKDPLFVETRASARVSQASLALQEARIKRENAYAHLASYWGANSGDVDVIEGIALMQRNETKLADADGALANAEVDRARAAVVVEQAKPVRDYEVSGGARILKGTNDVALVGGVSFPLGRFDKNQGNIERAQLERQRLELQAEANRLERLRSLAQLRADADAALTRANGIMAEVFPKTTKTLEQVRWGYNRGGFRFSDIEDAANAIIEVQGQWVEAMTRYRDVQADIDRLTGRFDPTDSTDTQPQEITP